MDVVAAWSELGGAWRRTFELAWEAHGRGTIPVGAVIVAPDGEHRGHAPGARGGEPACASRPLAPGEDHTLYASLEPCVLCVGAALLSTIGGIRYASIDVVGGGFTT